MARPKRSRDRSAKTNDYSKKDVKEEATEKEASKDEGKDTSKDVIPTKSNDPEWYSRDPRLLLDGARIPYNKPFGSELTEYDEVGNISAYLAAWPEERTSIPGICTLFVKSTIGFSWTKTDPVNVCANALYTHVRYLNSGRKNYDPADLMMYTLAFAEIYSYIYWLERIYNLAFMFSQRNYYIGREILLSEGIDVDSVVSNLANFRYHINAMINKVSSFCLPADIYMFKRRVFLYSNYYIENPYGNIKDQLYLMSPEGFYAFDYASNSSGMLKYHKLSRTRANPISVGGLVNVFNTLFANITGDEDFGLMSGDVLKAYQGNIIGIAPMPEEGMLVPTYDPFVLSQFKNATIINQSWFDDDNATFTGPDSGIYRYGDIGQSVNGLLICAEGSDDTNANSCINGILTRMNQYLSVENSDPDVGDTIEASRLMVGRQGFIKDSSGEPAVTLFSTGTEYVTRVEMTIHVADEVASVNKFDNYTLSGNIIQASAKTIFSAMSTTTVPVRCGFGHGFKYAPNLYVGHITVTTSGGITKRTLDALAPFCNLDNTTVVTSEDVTRLHEIALLSLYYVPGVAKILS